MNGKIKRYGAFLCVLMLLTSGGCTRPRETVRGFALDTEISITTDKKDAKAARAVLEKCRDYEKIFSRTDRESELYKLNSGETAEPSAELKEVIELGLSFSRLSGGAFDITIAPLTDLWDIKTRNIPPKTEEIAAALSGVGYEKISLNHFSTGGRRIDLGAAAKGYIADKIREQLKQQGIKNVIADLGGNVMLMGEYTVGIQSPFDSGKLYAKMRLKDTNAVTSGSYQRYFEYEGIRYHHILDARTGSCARSGVASVTVISPCSAQADALSTVIFILGKDGLDLCKKFDNTDAIIITDTGEYITTEGFAEKYDLEILNN